MSYDSTLFDLMREERRPRRRAVAARSLPFEWLVPPIRRSTLAIVALLCGAFVVASCFPLHHTDLWGHLSFGRWIAERDSLPTSDPFRPFDVSAAFTNIPWLAQWLGHEAYRAGGAQALLLVQSLLVTACCGVMLVAARLRGASASWSLLAAATSLVLAAPILGVLRPQLLGMLFFALLLAGLPQLATRRRPAVWIPVLFVLWANVHGSFVLGLLLLACWTLGVTCEARWADESWARVLRYRSIRRPWIVGLLSVLACCANPVGPRILVQVVGFSSQAHLAEITEWQPTVLASLTGGLLLITGLLTGLLLRFSPRRFRCEEILLLIVFGVLALSTLRMSAWWALVWPWVAVPHAAATWRRMASRMPRGDHRSRASFQYTALAGALMWMTLIWSPATHGYVSGRAPIEGKLLSQGTPLPLADALDELHVAGRMFAPLEWSDYLLWRRGTAIEPLVYCHVHLAGPQVWHDYQQLARGDDSLATIAERYALRWLVVDRTRQPGLLARLLGDGRARLMYQDRRALLFEWLPAADDQYEVLVEEKQPAMVPVAESVEKTQHTPQPAAAPSAAAAAANRFAGWA